MTKYLFRCASVALPVLLCAASVQAQQAFDASGWDIHAAEWRVETYRGRSALFLRDGAAWLKGSQFRNGTIEFDIVFSSVGGFPGIAFRAATRRRGGDPRAAALLTAAMHALRHGTGQPRVAELATRLGVSDRHLRRLVMDETGISPRQFARVQRFHALLRSADAAPRPAWAALAFRHGFADQPHLIREVQDLSGVTPARLHAQRRAE